MPTKKKATKPEKKEAQEEKKEQKQVKKGRQGLTIRTWLKELRQGLGEDWQRTNLNSQHPPAIAQVEVEEEEPQPTVPTPRRKMLAKKSKPQQSSVTTHYPFISTKAKRAFNETIQGKQPIKERTLDLDSYGTDKELPDIIRSLGWTELCKKPNEGVL